MTLGAQKDFQVFLWGEIEDLWQDWGVQSLLPPCPLSSSSPPNGAPSGEGSSSPLPSEPGEGVLPGGLV